MSAPAESPHGPASWDWRLLLSLGLTVTWLVLGFLYISSIVGWGDFVTQQAPALGGFLEGAFAPLAFLWLVVGFFLQQSQLHQNTQTIERQLVEMRRTAEQAEVQARAIKADELHSRQDTFLRTADLVYVQLGTIAGYILTSYWVGVGPEKMTGQGGGMELWAQHGRGDHSVFHREMTMVFYSGECDARELYWGTEIRSGHATAFMRSFERLLSAAAACDPTGMITDALREGTHGRAYRSMQESQPDRA